MEQDESSIESVAEEKSLGKRHSISTENKKMNEFKMFGINFEPLILPLRKEWELICVAFYLTHGPYIWPLVPFIFYYITFYTSLRFMVLPYFIWYIYDWNTPYTGGRSKNWVFGGLLTPIRNYFPAKLVKEYDLPKNSNYLLIAFPHGHISVGVMANFVMDKNFKETFPHLESRPIALAAFFKMPISREFFLCGGLSASSEDNLSILLSSKEKNKAVVLIVGGAAEAILSYPESNRIVLKERKGFVRIALKAGVPLVPVYTFGENEIFGTLLSGQNVRKFQNTVRKWTGIPPIFMRGRGFIQSSFGILPFRKPLTTIVGKPIPLPKIENPSQDEIDKYHEIFKQELIDLFERNKEKYDCLGSQAKLVVT